MKLSRLQMIVAGLYVMVSVVGVKAVAIGPLTLAGGGLLVAMMKPLLDIINELYGRDAVKETATNMALSRFFVYVSMLAISFLPARHEPAGFSKEVLASGFLLFAFGVINEYVMTRYVDVPLFEWLRNNTNLGFLLRQYGSNLSMLMQILVFTAFYAVMKPHVPTGSLFAGQLVMFALTMMVFAPVAALAVRRAKRK